MKKNNAIITVLIGIMITLGCSTKLETGKEYTLAEILHHARNGEVIKSKGIIAGKIEGREFIVSENGASLILNLQAFKKESKNLKEGTKVVFTGEFHKKLFSEPEVRASMLQSIDNFR